MSRLILVLIILTLLPFPIKSLAADFAQSPDGVVTQVVVAEDDNNPAQVPEGAVEQAPAPVQEAVQDPTVAPAAESEIIPPPAILPEPTQIGRAHV